MVELRAISTSASSAGSDTTGNKQADLRVGEAAPGELLLDERQGRQRGEPPSRTLERSTGWSRLHRQLQPGRDVGVGCYLRACPPHRALRSAGATGIERQPSARHPR